MFTTESAFHVLYSENIDKTHDFYQKISSEIKEKTSDKVVVQLGDYDLHFVLNSTEPFAEYQYVAEKKDYGNGILFYVGVENIDAAFTLIKEAGGATKSEIKDNHWGAREFLFEDPNGYKFVIYQ